VAPRFYAMLNGMDTSVGQVSPSNDTLDSVTALKGQGRGRGILPSLGLGRGVGAEAHGTLRVHLEGELELEGPRLSSSPSFSFRRCDGSTRRFFAHDGLSSMAHSRRQ